MGADLLDFSGKVVAVTGAAAGIGRACAEAFATRGAKVHLADIETEANEAAAAAIRERGGAALAHGFDVADEAACANFIETIISASGRLDILVNNAAMLARGGVVDLDAPTFDRVLAVNLRAAFILTQHAARKMQEQGIKGAIVNMSSINAEVAIPGQLAYVVSKGGLRQLTRAAALDLATSGVRVNAIAPGSIMTDILRAVMADEKKKQIVLSRTPLGRVGEPSEIANIALFLASDMASYVTGHTVVADGGRLALNYVMTEDA